MGASRSPSLRTLLSFLGLCVVAAATARGADDPATTRFRPPLGDILAQSSEDRPVPVSIVLSDRIPVERLRAAKQGLGRSEGRIAVVICCARMPLGRKARSSRAYGNSSGTAPRPRMKIATMFSKNAILE